MKKKHIFRFQEPNMLTYKSLGKLPFQIEMFELSLKIEIFPHFFHSKKFIPVCKLQYYEIISKKRPFSLKPMKFFGKKFASILYSIEFINEPKTDW